MSRVEYRGVGGPPAVEIGGAADRDPTAASGEANSLDVSGSGMPDGFFAKMKFRMDLVDTVPDVLSNEYINPLRLTLDSSATVALRVLIRERLAEVGEMEAEYAKANHAVVRGMRERGSPNLALIAAEVRGTRDMYRPPDQGDSVEAEVGMATFNGVPYSYRIGFGEDVECDRVRYGLYQAKAIAVDSFKQFLANNGQ